MTELYRSIKIAKAYIRKNNDGSTKPMFTPIFAFPFTDDHLRWVKHLTKQIPTEGRKNWVIPYSYLIESQIIPSGIKIPKVWLRRTVDGRNEYRIGYHTNSVYLIADINETVLYIGKCEFPPPIRLFDRMIPRKLNSENNVPEIWENFISKGARVKCAYCYDLSFDPGFLEYYLIDEYEKKYSGMPAYNHQRPSSRYADIDL